MKTKKSGNEVTGSNMSHTPPPWKISCAKGLDVYDRDGHVVFRSRLPEDAEFIVRAVNSHEALVAAAKAAYELLKDQYVPGEVQANLKDAIAQAEGRP